MNYDDTMLIDRARKIFETESGWRHLELFKEMFDRILGLIFLAIVLTIIVSCVAQKSKRDIYVVKANMDITSIGFNEDTFTPNAKVVWGVYFDTVFFVINNQHHNQYSPIKLNEHNKKVIATLSRWVDSHTGLKQHCFIRQNNFGELTLIHTIYADDGYIIFINTVEHNSPHYVLKYPSSKGD